MAETLKNKDTLSTELSRDLNLFHVSMMGIGMMIGAGVFLGIGNAVHHSGPGGAILTFALNGLVALFTAMSYAELSSAVPRAGGAYNFARIGFGRRVSFLAGWMEWFASSIAGSAYAVTFAIYVWRYLNGLGILRSDAGYSPFIEKATAALIAIGFVYINYRGASETGKIGALFALAQTLFLVLIGVVGVIIVVRDPSRLGNFSPFLPHGWTRLFVTMGFTYVAFEGYEVIAQAGDETISPKQNLPKAMIYSVFAVTITYVAVTFATIVAVKTGDPGIDTEVWKWIGGYGAKGFGEAVGRIMPFANFFLTLAVIFASTSALNATIFSATRASYALGRDGMLPGGFAKIADKTKTPYIALIITGCILIIISVSLDALNIASTASIMFLFLFFLVNICVIKIRRNMGDELEYGFMMPLFPYLPILAIIFQVILVFHLHEVSRAALIIGPAWVIIGVLVFQFYSKSHAKDSEEEVLVLEEEKTELKRKTGNFNVMVAISNPDNAVSLVTNTYRICGAKKSNVDLLHVVKIPAQIPLADAHKFALDGKEGIVEMMMYLAPRFPVNTSVRYCRSVSRGILSAVREKKTDLLIMGWHGDIFKGEFGLGSTLDPVIERSPSDIVVFKNPGNQVFKRILVPISGGQNSSLALEVADILADEKEGVLTALFVDTGRYEFDINDFVRKTEQRLDIDEGTIQTLVVKSEDPISAVLSETDNHDLVVIGCTFKPAIHQFWKPSFPEEFANKCNKPIAMVKASMGIRSWLRKWI